MFGSKIRSWMENHIVRPRKKGNKNKNGNVNNLGSGNNTQNGHKGTSYQGDSTIGSPARRSEVSPIQNNTTSRRGWQSPNQDMPISPKSDHYPYHHHIVNNKTGTTTATITAAPAPPPLTTATASPLPQHTQHQHQYQQQHQQLRSPPNSAMASRNSSYTLDNKSYKHQKQQDQYSKSVDASSLLPTTFSHSHTSATLHKPIMYQLRDVDLNKNAVGNCSGTYSRSKINNSTSINNNNNNNSSHILSNNINNNSINSYSNHSSSLNYITPTSSSSNELLDQHDSIKYENIKMSSSSSSSINTTTATATTTDNMHHAGIVCAANNKKNNIYNHISPGNSSTFNNNNSNGINNNNNNNSMNINGNNHNTNTNNNNNSINNNVIENQYGKIQPIKTTSGNKCLQNYSSSLKSYDQFNGNVQYQLQQLGSNCIMGSISAGTNGASSGGSTSSSGGGGGGGGSSKKTTTAPSSGGYQSSGLPTNNCDSLALRNGKGVSAGSGNGSNMLRPTTANVTTAPPSASASHLHHYHYHHPHAGHSGHPHQHPSAAAGGATHHTHHQITHMVNTLSSPESAYSTGYSTDGTSPGGCSYTPTPEYYINIRTGTHYFPKGLNPIGESIAGGIGGIGGGIGGIGNRFKCGLNRIEEKHVEFIIDDKPATNYYHKRAESCDAGRSVVNQIQSIEYNKTNMTTTVMRNNSVCMSPVLQKNLGIQHYRSIESPSPRQRCRIRTNPWFSNAEAQSLAGTAIGGGGGKQQDPDASSTTSSGIKSNSDNGSDDKKKSEIGKISDSDSSTTSTEKNSSRKLFTASDFRKLKPSSADNKNNHSRSSSITVTLANNSNVAESDDDATLNEMMGKYDESYVYEKETDILSDSDPTDCNCLSDLDTGQDAGDECDTDDLLDIDFIDTGSIQEIIDKDVYKNTGSCSYHHFSNERKSSKSRRSSRKQLEDGNSKRRKKFVRTRKKNAEKDSNGVGNNDKSPPPGNSRGCRSVGGTPMSTRRNQAVERKNNTDMKALSNRCNSLTFTEIFSMRSRMLAISESEKALLKADLEADVKYKQLIHEAETILVSMKTNALKDPPPPIISPRRVCNLPTNKRVEMLRNCEADLKRELAKTTSAKAAAEGSELNPAEGAIVNKRLEILRCETSVSAPNSPKVTRVAPRKTHITNFINQYASPTEMIRRKSTPDPPPISARPPKLQPPKSPTPSRRRFRSQSPMVHIPSDSDSEEIEDELKSKNQQRRNGNKENSSHKNTGKTNSKNLQYSSSLNESDILHHNGCKPPLISFRSVDIGNSISEDSAYCPQSEPLKRKIYTCSSTYDKIQRSLDVDSDIPKKALLNRISLLRLERQCAKDSTATSTNHGNTPDQNESANEPNELVSVLEDIKACLNDQNLELYELHDSDN